MTLALIQYTDSVPTGFAGVTYGPWVRILTRKRDDAGLLAHELLHVKQFWDAVLAFACWVPALWLMPHDVALWLVLGAAIVALLCRKTLTLMAEVDAYRLQLKVTTEAVPLSMAEAENRARLFATFISTEYGLSITVTDALKLITE
jgi:hypothetical protein